MSIPPSIVDLDFDSVKASLRDYLRSQSQFRDYNFEGSGLSVLLDLLSANTHYLAFYTAMVGNEMFLDSATLRSSVVSLAKQLGYTPRSISAARAVVSITVQPTDGAATLVIPQGTRFNSSISGTSYIFVTDQTYAASLTNGQFVFPAVTLVQGIPYTYRITADSAIPNQVFALPGASIDTKTLTVKVQQSATNLATATFLLSDNFLQVTADTPAYFLQEGKDGIYEVYFGDGILGQAVQDGNIVILNYVVTAGTAVNGASSFTPAQSIGGYPLSNIIVATVAPASGGADAESIDSIRFTAPKSFESQGRAVTASDYQLLIQNNYSKADSVIVWGGEIENPPQYGKVFISIKPVDGFVVTETEKRTVLASIVSARNLVAVIPEFVDPDYTYIVVSSEVKYFASSTDKTAGAIQNIAYNAILSFAQNDLDKFDQDFKYSRLLAAIDSSDPSISNNLTTIQLKKIFSPVLGASQNYTFAMNTAVLAGSVVSSKYTFAGQTYYVADNGKGAINLVLSVVGQPDRTMYPVGTIDYNTGSMSFSISPTQADANGSIRLTMTPAEPDISPVRNNILYIDPADVSVSAVAVS